LKILNPSPDPLNAHSRQYSTTNNTNLTNEDKTINPQRVVDDRPAATRQWHSSFVRFPIREIRLIRG
jgi:hypothetical protein